MLAMPPWIHSSHSNKRTIPSFLRLSESDPSNLFTLCPNCHAGYDATFPDWVLIPDPKTLQKYIDHEKDDFINSVIWFHRHLLHRSLIVLFHPCAGVPFSDHNAFDKRLFTQIGQSLGWESQQHLSIGQPIVGFSIQLPSSIFTWDAELEKVREADGCSRNISVTRWRVNQFVGKASTREEKWILIISNICNNFVLTMTECS